MIQLKNLTPHVYSDQSRDFQFIERLFDVILNSVKTAGDNLYTLPISDDSNEQLLTLMSLTLGFKSRHHYNNTQLRSLCSCFSEIMRNKGSLYAIDTLGKALLNADGITDELTIEKNDSDPFALDIYVPQDLSDTNLLEDVFDYVLPAGMSYNIIRELKLKIPAVTSLTTQDQVTIYDNSNNARGTAQFDDVVDSTVSTVATKDDITALGNSITAGTNLKAIPGMIGNSTVVQPKKKEE
jgi:hypothetical protein